MSATTKGNARSSGYEKEADEWYAEAPESVFALLDAERPSGPVFDPACGMGTIVGCCEARGIECRGSDLVDRVPLLYARLDFLKAVATEPRRLQAMISNPPFSLTEKFVDHCFDGGFADTAIVFQRLAFQEGRKRMLWHRQRGLARVWVHSSRQRLRPGGQEIHGNTSGSIAFAWYVYVCGHTGAWAGDFLP